jgi:Flp pilus assembly protein TadG
MGGHIVRIIKRGENGQAMVEFALILPILILILCGIIDFGWIFGNQVVLSNATRESARYMAMNYDSTATLAANKAVAVDVLDDLVPPAVIPADMTVTFSAVVGTDSTSITVGATYPLKVLTPLVGVILGNTFTISASTTMRAE